LCLAQTSTKEGKAKLLVQASEVKGAPTWDGFGYGPIPIIITMLTSVRVDTEYRRVLLPAGPSLLRMQLSAELG
jgi:hypothetical protein